MELAPGTFQAAKNQGDRNVYDIIFAIDGREVASGPAKEICISGEYELPLQAIGELIMQSRAQAPGKKKM